MSQQQTVLRVKTNYNSQITVTGQTGLTITVSATGFTYSGTGSVDDPYTGIYSSTNSYIDFYCLCDGVLHYDYDLGTSFGIGDNNLIVYIKHAGETSFKQSFNAFNRYVVDYFKVKKGDTIRFLQNYTPIIGDIFTVYLDNDLTTVEETVPAYDFLDLYDNIPISINRSFAEIQDISKRNSDLSIGLKLPGTKKNNRFFEDFYNVDNVSYYFDVTKKIECQVLINDEAFFTGYLRLNSINLLNTKVEYDVTLFSTVADLYGKIGTNTLRDLDFRDVDYHFNHVFTKDNVIANWKYETLKSSREVPSNYMYPIFHNGYNYQPEGDTSKVLTGTTSGTTIYTTTKLGQWANNSAAYSAGVQEGFINSPNTGLRDNQLKPAINVYTLLKLMFKTAGYKFKSDFLNTPWFKLLYMYGYFSDNSTKLTYQTPQTETFGKEGIALYFSTRQNYVDVYVVKNFTGIPAYCNVPVKFYIRYYYVYAFVYEDIVYEIAPNTTGSTIYTPFGVPDFKLVTGYGPLQNQTDRVNFWPGPLSYAPSQANTVIPIIENSYLDFNLMIDKNIKQIDILSSIAKKFDLLFVPNPDDPTEIIVEPFDYYVGTGQVYDWTDKINYDKGITITPAQNFIDAEIVLTDDEDGDQGNIDFKKANDRIYGEFRVKNPTEFKSSTKDIKTTFSNEIFRKWNPSAGIYSGTSLDVGIPLGINYTEQSQENGTQINWTYSGVKTKPKLFYNLGNFSPFLDRYGEMIVLTGTTTSTFNVSKNDGTSITKTITNPVTSNVMPIGIPDQNKITNDTITITFNSEQTTTESNETIESYDLLNSYTDNNLYNLFYLNRITNDIDRNTRFISAQFDLDIQEIRDLEPKDLIKFKEQYFLWNKIENYNLSYKEPAKIELIQFNTQNKKYPERYFKYQYCSGNTTTYKFKTNFTDVTSIKDSRYYYSILYDYFVGAINISGTTGFTTSVPYTGGTYLPFTWWEVSEQDYLASGTTYTSDPNKNFFIDATEDFPTSNLYNQANNVWLINSGQTKAYLNVFTGCTDFNTKASSIGVLVAGATTGYTYQSGATINVTSAGNIRYETPSLIKVDYFAVPGTYTIVDCVLCNSIVPAPPPSINPASFTIISCGTNC